LRETVPPPVPPSEAAPVEFHEALSAELQQPSTIEPSVEASAAPKAFGVARGADFKMSIYRLLGSESSLREAILLREILGPPRGLQAQDLL